MRVLAAVLALAAIAALVGQSSFQRAEEPRELLSASQPLSRSTWQQQEQGLWRQLAHDARLSPTQKMAMVEGKPLSPKALSPKKLQQAKAKLFAIRSELAHLKAARKGFSAKPSAPRAQRLFAKNGVTYFKGHMLCAEGEKSCSHPCNAFYTVTEKPTDCHCQCTENPNSFSGDVICACPDSPISAENDMFPYPEGEGPAAAPAQPETETEATAETSTEAAAAPATAEAEPAAATEAATEQGEAPAAAAQEAAAQARRMGMYRHYNRRAAMLAAMRQQGVAQQFPAWGKAYYRGPTGLWVGAPPPLLPPNGDYPGGSTGIPMDGYAAFDTGYGAEPYHGMQSGMQNIGISDKALPQQMNLGRRFPYPIVNI